MDDKLVVVAGATGYLGRHVVTALHEAGYRVRALTRSEARLAPVRRFCDEVFVGQATQPETLGGLCDGAWAVFSSLGIRAATGKITYEDVDYRANANLVQMAREAGVERFLFVSVLHGEKVRFAVPQADARERVVDELRDSGLGWTVFRPTGFFNDMAEFFEMARKGRVWLVGDGTRRINPIHGADLAEFIVDKLGRDDSLGRSFDVGGPEVFTYRAIGELAFEVLGKKPRFGKVPPWLLKGTGHLLSPFSPNLANLLLFFGMMGDMDAVGPSVGTRTLRAFYEELRDQGVPRDLRMNKRT